MLACCLKLEKRTNQERKINVVFCCISLCSDYVDLDISHLSFVPMYFKVMPYKSLASAILPFPAVTLAVTYALSHQLCRDMALWLFFPPHQTLIFSPFHLFIVRLRHVAVFHIRFTQFSQTQVSDL